MKSKSKMPWCNRVKRRYYKRAERYLVHVAEAARLQGFETGGAFDMSDDEWTLCLDLQREGEPVADVMLHFSEERVREGDGEGMALDVSITANGGRSLGGFCPGNFSSELWVEPGNYEEFDRRMDMLESIPAGEWPESVAKFMEG